MKAHKMASCSALQTRSKVPGSTPQARFHHSTRSFFAKLSITNYALLSTAIPSTHDITGNLQMHLEYMAKLTIFPLDF
eukprot:c14752_g2_i1 orf=58-291(-)